MRAFKMLTTTLLGVFSLSSTIYAGCPMCDEIREYNAEHHKNYTYYEDYLKELGNAPASEESLKNAPAPIQNAATAKKAAPVVAEKAQK